MPPGLAMAVQPYETRTIFNFSHSRMTRFMPVTSFTGEDMFLRGYNQYNDSRQKPGIKPVALVPLDPDGEAHFRHTYNIDADAVRALYDKPH